MYACFRAASGCASLDNAVTGFDGLQVQQHFDGMIGIIPNNLHASRWRLFAEPKSKCSIQHYTDGSAVETTLKNGTISDFGRTDSGEKTLTLFSQNACVVAYKDADGNYVRLKALANEDGSYRYSIPGGVAEVTVAVKGDLDSDGQLTAKEARQLLTASTNASTLTKLQYLCTDLDGNGVISAREARILLKASTGNAAIDW